MRSYSDILTKSSQVRCCECVFCTPNEKAFQRLTFPYICCLTERPIKNAEKESCPKGKVPL